MTYPDRRWLALAVLVLAVSGCKAVCGGGGSTIGIDGSSTVYPITEAVAETYQDENDARITISVSGTGGGFKKFCRGTTSINNASRPIKPVEVERCKENGIDFIELPVAYDGITVVTHPDNDWVDSMTVSQLQEIWKPAAQDEITQWSQVDDDWPDEPLELFGPGVDSGTYDYFAHAIVGADEGSRGDFTSSEDDNVLVHGVANNKNSLGFFGYAYYADNKEKLQPVPIDDGNPDNGEGPIAASDQTIANGTYQPLSRPLFIYIRASEASKPHVQQFVDFYLSESREAIKEVGYIPFPEETYGLVGDRFESRTTGSMFEGEGAKVGVTVRQLLEKE